MTLAETIYQHSLLLPEQAARGALDFIEFLEQRYNVASVASNAPENTNNLLSVMEEVMINDESTPYISPLYKALVLLAVLTLMKSYPADTKKK